MMAIESSFIPFPSEIVLIPAGYIASKGEMSIEMIMLSGVVGSLVGAFINYYLAFFVGRPLLVKYGKYIFIQEHTLIKMEKFFAKHGHISTFIGRLIPGIRQLISIPAGLSKMNQSQFFLFTTLGASIWALVLVLLGYFLGENEALIHKYLQEITFVTLSLLFILSFVYYAYQKKKG